MCTGLFIGICYRLNLYFKYWYRPKNSMSVIHSCDVVSEIWFCETLEMLRRFSYTVLKRATFDKRLHFLQCCALKCWSVSCFVKCIECLVLHFEKCVRVMCALTNGASLCERLKCSFQMLSLFFFFLALRTTVSSYHAPCHT